MRSTGLDSRAASSCHFAPSFVLERGALTECWQPCEGSLDLGEQWNDQLVCSPLLGASRAALRRWRRPGQLYACLLVPPASFAPGP